MPGARSIAIVMGVTICLIASAARAEIKVTRWPDDGPCDAVKKSPAGAWVLVTTVTQGPITRKNGETFAERRIVEYWDRKCARKP